MHKITGRLRRQERFARFLKERFFLNILLSGKDEQEDAFQVIGTISQADVHLSN